METDLSGITTNVILGLLGGAISGISAHYFAPWFKWKLEVKHEAIKREHESKLKAIADIESDKEEKRKLIKQWREMLVNVYNESESNNIQPQSILQRSSVYLSLEPYLTYEAKRAVYGECRTIVIGSTFQGALLALKEEISRIEKDWNLL